MNLEAIVRTCSRLGWKLEGFAAFSDERSIVICSRICEPGQTPAEYVTWDCNIGRDDAGDVQASMAWGHYAHDKGVAFADFHKRHAQHILCPA